MKSGKCVRKIVNSPKRDETGRLMCNIMRSICQDLTILEFWKHWVVYSLISDLAHYVIFKCPKVHLYDLILNFLSLLISAIFIVCTAALDLIIIDSD